MTAKVTESNAIDALAIMEVMTADFVKESLPLRTKIGALAFRVFVLELSSIAGTAYEEVTENDESVWAFDYDFLPRWLEGMFRLDDYLTQPESLSDKVTPLLRTQLLEEVS